MKKILYLLALLSAVLTASRTDAQILVCNDLVSAAVDENCQITVIPEFILEGTIPLDCVVEVDKIAPFGNGPWVPAEFGPDDIDHMYMVRVRHVPSGNMCWGNIEIVDKTDPVLECSGLSSGVLDANGELVLFPDGTAAFPSDACSNFNEIELSFPGGQTSLSYDCSDIGMHIIDVQATDASGNTATCQTSLLIYDPVSVCEPCINFCPNPVAVTYETGTEVLLPAYQTGDNSVFVPYGEASYKTTSCPAATLTYSVEYVAGPAGQSWFDRNWWWKDVNDLPVGHCQQVISYGSSQFNTIQGTVYFETTGNCVLDAGETGTNNFPIIVTTLPSGTQHTAVPNADGTYNISFLLFQSDSVAVVKLLTPPNIFTVCPNTFTVPFTGATQNLTFDFGLLSEGDCPSMQANLYGNFYRRCQSNAFQAIYCNVSLDTAYNAYMVVDLDSLISLQTADLPYTIDNDGNYVFQLGDVPPLQCNILQMTVFISCDAEIGQTLCNSVTIFPSDPCSGTWTGPEVVATARCNGDKVDLAIWNQGSQDMGAPLNFIVIEDFIMYKDGPFQIAAGDSVTIQVPANGSTWRLEAEQVDGFPWPGAVSAAIEGCGGLNTPGLITAFPQNDDPGFYDEYCAIVTGSYDPNDKTAVPTGYSAEHTIRANEDLEYKIRFQNTGNDAAYRVVVVDTLSPLLDWASLEPGAASHPYRLDVFPGGILNFVFDPINLPDSTSNEAGSHGFVSFRIAQQPDLPIGTVIENTAAIYFDNNDPIITNTAFHTIGKLEEVALQSQTPFVPGVTASLSPNPFSEQAVLDIRGRSLQQGMLNLYDAQGRLLRTQTMQNNQTLIERKDLPAGVCFFQVTDNGTVVVTGKLVVE